MQYIIFFHDIKYQLFYITQVQLHAVLQFACKYVFPLPLIYN